MAISDWTRIQRRVYFGNASSVRDYRAQLRGTRPALFWTLYLGLLILFVTLAYSNVVVQGEQSITVIQVQLKSFYQSVLGMLELMVALVAPVVVGMSIQAEVQRKSLELIATAPVSPKYFLVGKVLSGYRYVLMLLFLSLPIAAAAVMLGGATWGEVLVTYLLVAMHGLFYIGISLPIAVISTKVVPAVIYSYMACWAWAFGSAIPVASAVMMSGMAPGGARAEAPFYMLMFPGAFFLGVDSYTTIRDVQVPNWIIATAVTLLIVKCFIVGAGSAMTRIGSKETVSLRIHGLVVTAVLTAAYSMTMLVGRAAAAIPGSAAVFDPAHELAAFFAGLSLPIAFVLPFLSTWSYMDERKHKPTGFFDVRQALSGAPEGGLPYIMLLLATMYAVGGAVWVYHGAVVDSHTLVYLAWLTGAWAFFWSMGWLVSSFAKSGIGTARKSHLAFTVIVTLLPWPVLGIVGSILNVPPEDLFRIYPVAGLFFDSTEIWTVGFHALEFWIFARRRSVVSLMQRATNERKPA
jgi:hypothetical protein